MRLQSGTDAGEGLPQAGWVAEEGPATPQGPIQRPRRAAHEHDGALGPAFRHAEGERRANLQVAKQPADPESGVLEAHGERSKQPAKSRQGERS